jgi:hypothetical protein
MDNSGHIKPQVTTAVDAAKQVRRPGRSGFEPLIQRQFPRPLREE